MLNLSDGSCTLESPYHLSLLLYEFCTENGFMNKLDDVFYDRILFKFTLYSSLIDVNSSAENEDSDRAKLLASSKIIQDDLLKLLNYNIDENYQSPHKAFELNEATFAFLKSLFLDNPLKAKSLIDILLKYNSKCQNLILSIHLSVVSKLIEELDCKKQHQRRRSSVLHITKAEVLQQQQQQNENDNAEQENLIEKAREKILKLFSILCVYNFESKCHDFYASVDLLSKCFRNLCYKLNYLNADKYEELEKSCRQVYASLLFEYNETDETKNDKNNNNDQNETLNMLDLFSKVQYQVEKELTLSSTFNDETLPILSLIKQYSNLNNTNPSVYSKETQLWRRLFLFCYHEKKILLKSLINECLELINRNQYDNLALIFSVKEFLNLKPLILLLGISKSHDINNAKKIITSLCVNNDKGTLINKLGNLLKTHLDFMTWFQQTKRFNFLFLSYLN